MKPRILILACLSAVILYSCSGQKATISATPEQVVELLAEKQYLFFMQYVRPASGRQRMISGNYTLVVTKNSVEADLPYFGRAYNATMGTDGGMKFRSEDFSYEMVSRKNDSREITIRPRDVSDIQVVYLTVFSNGSADLRIQSNSRQAISYQGDIRALPQPK